MAIHLRIRPDRLLQLRFGFEPERADIQRLLSRASRLLREREGASDVLVDATHAGTLDHRLDLEFLSWIVLHYSQVRLFAVVVESLHCCEERLKRLELVSAKTFGVFTAERAAKHWLSTRAWPDESE